MLEPRVDLYTVAIPPPRDLVDHSDGAHLTSFGIVFQTEKEKENERSTSVALLCAGLLRRGMVHELE